MMQSLGYNDCVGHLRNAREISNVFPRTNPTLATERNYFSISGVSVEQSIILRPGRLFDLKLSADQCASHVGEDLSGTEEHFNLCIGNNSMTKEDSKSFDAGLLDLNEAYPNDSSCNSNDPIITQNHSPESVPNFSGGISVNPTNIGALKPRTDNLEHSDDQTKELRSNTFELSIEPKSENFRDCKGQKNEEDEDGPVIKKKQPIWSLSASDQFSTTEIGSQVSKTSISAEQEWISCHRINSRNKIVDKNEVSAEVDPSIQNAAILLINMFTENSAHATSYHRPQCSSDSFEMIALKLRENSTEDNSVSSTPVETKNEDNRDYSFKLRRGRRLKDFQKEILPGLATLSRHEICEDMNILEAVLRSKECKKERSKNGRRKQMVSTSEKQRIKCGTKTFIMKHYKSEYQG